MQGKGSVNEPGSGPSAGFNSVCILTLDFLTSKTMGINSWCLEATVYDNLLNQPEWTQVLLNPTKLQRSWHDPYRQWLAIMSAVFMLLTVLDGAIEWLRNPMASFLQPLLLQSLKGHWQKFFISEVIIKHMLLDPAIIDYLWTKMVWRVSLHRKYLITL